MMLYPIMHFLDFFSIRISQPVAISVSRTQNANMLKRDFINVATIKILYLKVTKIFYGTSFETSKIVCINWNRTDRVMDG